MTIKNKKLVSKTKTKTKTKTKNKNKYVLVRTFSAGVHFGVLKKIIGYSSHGKDVLLTETRRIWYWDGAASLSQMARDGVSKPENCKFSVTIEENNITEAIEIIPCTEQAIKSIKAVNDWVC